MQGVLIHTGQHYDKNMSGNFFLSLGIPAPDYNMEVGSGSHAVQTANVMCGFENVCEKENPDMVLVVGDVNSTIAAGLVAKKLDIGLCHVEAGLRSGDRKMPEEINRLATDAISDLFFTTEKEGTQNLLHEGHSPDSVHFVGHVMIDNLYFQLEKLKEHSAAVVSPEVHSLKRKISGNYLCMTMHRPSNVDNSETLNTLLNAINSIAQEVPVIFPCHPRTRKNIEQFNLMHHVSNVDNLTKEVRSGIILSEPLGYDDFLYLWKDAACILTDSGGLQEESTALKIPCITMRESTERPITTEVGSNVIAGSDTIKITNLVNSALQKKWKNSIVPELWDGNASKRIVSILKSYLSNIGRR
jgi:UDP-N-acetylglucosamine 2-epimerase (non-hydrolysing)